MSTDINSYLRNLQENARLNNLLTDDSSEVTVGLDLYTGEYKGARVKFEKDGATIYINTAESSVVIYDEKRSSEKLETLTSLAIDYEVINKFNIYKLDEDYFADLKDSISTDMQDLFERESKDFEEELVEVLKEIKESDYSPELVDEHFRRFKINEKSDHLVLARQLHGTSIKYNTGKNKFTVKNITSYKNKFQPDDRVTGFDTYKFNEVIRNLNHKKNYNERRSELDDGLSDSYSSLTGLSFFEDPGL